MKIVYCRSCANEMPDTTPTCTECGAPQARVYAAAALADVAPVSTPGLRAIGKRLLVLVLGGVSVVCGVMVYIAFAWNSTPF